MCRGQKRKDATRGEEMHDMGAVHKWRMLTVQDETVDLGDDEETTESEGEKESATDSNSDSIEDDETTESEGEKESATDDSSDDEETTESEGEKESATDDNDDEEESAKDSSSDDDEEEATEPMWTTYESEEATQPMWTTYESEEATQPMYEVIRNLKKDHTDDMDILDRTHEKTTREAEICHSVTVGALTTELSVALAKATMFENLFRAVRELEVHHGVREQ
jgi:hypothetical protein